MFAVVSYKGNQYKIEPEKEYKIDLIEPDKKTIIFDNVLLLDDGKEIKVGTPSVTGAKVEAEVLSTLNDKKVSVVKFHSKKRYKKLGGHRQQYTIVKITSIKA